MLPEERRRIRHVHEPGQPERLAQPIDVVAAPLAGVEMRGAIRAQRALERVDLLVRREMPGHGFSRSRRRRLRSAWKKLAFTDPTELPRIAAIS